MDDSVVLEQAIARIDHGDTAWEDDDEVITNVVVNQPLDKVVPVRLTAAHWSQLYEEARELGIGPTTLIRMWVLERLRERHRTKTPA